MYFRAKLAIKSFDMNIFDFKSVSACFSELVLIRIIEVQKVKDAAKFRENC